MHGALNHPYWDTRASSMYFGYFSYFRKYFSILHETEVRINVSNVNATAHAHARVINGVKLVCQFSK